jgi:hypothetical protein
MRGAGQVVQNRPADGGFSATDLAGQDNEPFAVLNAVEQGVKRFAVAFGKEKEPRIGRHVERKLTELEKREVHGF